MREWYVPFRSDSIRFGDLTNGACDPFQNPPSQTGLMKKVLLMVDYDVSGGLATVGLIEQRRLSTRASPHGVAECRFVGQGWKVSRGVLVLFSSRLTDDAVSFALARSFSLSPSLYVSFGCSRRVL